MIHVFTFFQGKRGCREFWADCRLNVLPIYQCNRFWEKCRVKLIDEDPNWEYPGRPCNTSSKCQLDWLNETTQPGIEDDRACYDFSVSCRARIDEKYPNFTYPVQYCEDNPELTCKMDWLSTETNPYDENDQEACYQFFEYCNLELTVKHERHAWPLPPPATVDDFMQGKVNCL